MNIYELKKVIIQADFELLKESLEEYNINENDKFGNNILHDYLNYIFRLKSEIPNNCFDIIELFIEKGIDLDARQSKGSFRRCPLHQVVSMNRRELFDFLISKGANVNNMGPNDGTVLLTAIDGILRDRVNSEYYVKRLLELGADPFKESKNGVSAYSFAVMITDTDVLDWLAPYVKNRM
ncbi:ankyrin repeat domain-containing protein [Myroides sp.]|uniref:ankyrin repeat domain-containing protein n=1 Tax=Myroides sp. TaxID=1874736 RepID=UPI003F30F319